MDKQKISEDYKWGFWAGQHSVVLPSTKKQIAEQVFLEWWEGFLEPDMHKDGFFHRVKSCYMRWLKDKV